MKKIFIISACLILLFSSQITSASIKNNIIAKVGNEIVTSIELENKIKFNLLITETQINQKNIDNLKSYALKSLINLKLKNVELKKYNFRDNPVAIDDHLKKLSRKFNVKKSQLKEFFLNNKIDYDQYLEEIKTEFLWQKLIYQLYVKEISIDNNQISTELNLFIKENKQENIPEFHLAEIEILLEDNLDTKDVIAFIEKNIMDKGFEKTAINFSSSTTALDGGDLGWIKSTSLSKRIAGLLKEKNIGEITEPFIEANKIIFFKILDKRYVKSEKKLNIEQVKDSIISKKKK